MHVRKCKKSSDFKTSHYQCLFSKELCSPELSKFCSYAVYLWVFMLLLKPQRSQKVNENPGIGNFQSAMLIMSWPQPPLPSGFILQQEAHLLSICLSVSVVVTFSDSFSPSFLSGKHAPRKGSEC